MAAFILALPSKGRLQEESLQRFAEIGLDIQRRGGGRAYRAAIPDAPDIEIQLLSAQEIADAILAGAVNAGVAGEDLLRESGEPLAEKAFLAHAFGFGRADLVVAVSEAWIDVVHMADLDDAAAEYRAQTGRRLRAATKYPNLSRAFFADHGVENCRFVSSSGATEGAPAAGAAELIVDITTSGATLADNGLRPLADGLILRSQAQLAYSLRANWSQQALARAREILVALEAYDAARDESRQLLLPDAALEPAAHEALRVEFGLDAHGVHAFAGPARSIRRAGAALAARQKAGVTILSPQARFSPDSSSFARFEAALARRSSE